MRCRRMGAALLLAFTIGRAAAAQQASGKSTTALPTGTQGAAPPAAEANSAPASESAEPPVVGAPYVAEAVAPAREPERRWYGWQIIIADVASTTVLFTLVDKIQGYAFLPYVVLAPSVHIANGNPLTSLASVGVRFGIPVVGLLIGAAFAGGCTGSSEECLAGPAYGMLAGMVGAMAVDASVLAYDEPPRRKHKASTFVPTMAVDRRGARVGLVGSF